LPAGACIGMPPVTCGAARFATGGHSMRPSQASGPSQWPEASRSTPRTTLKTPQATRTRTHRRGRRYSRDLTRNLMRTDLRGSGVVIRRVHRDASCELRCRPLRSPVSQCSPHANRTSTVRIPEPEVGLARSLLLTISTLRRPERTACTDCTPGRTECPHCTGSRTGAFHDPFHAPTPTAPRLVTLRHSSPRRPVPFRLSSVRRRSINLSISTGTGSYPR
jgi:hypothetical protein